MADHYTLDDLLTLMSRLREPHYGCPWDLAQTYKTITASTLEEAYEVIDAIEEENYSQLKEELGDLLFQVVFYSQLGKEDDIFDFHQVVASITAKLLRRHPHVFPDGTLDSRIDPGKTHADREQANIKASWEQIKQQERKQKGAQGIMDDIPTALPATTRAVKLQKRASSVGFDWQSIDGIYEKIDEEIVELKQAVAEGEAADITDEVGDLLFTVINLARHLKIDPETALRYANKKFEKRFSYLEETAVALQQTIQEQPAETLEHWWRQAKRSVSADQD